MVGKRVVCVCININLLDFEPKEKKKYGNDEDGVDGSNPGQGNGTGTVQDKPGKANDDTTIKLAFAGQLDVYDMNGKLVNINNAPSGMYLVVNNGEITKIVK